MRNIIYGAILLAPAYAGAQVWFEAGAGPWLPFFGAFSTNHNMGIEGKIRAGFWITPPDRAVDMLPFIQEGTKVAPFVEVYHTWNQLKSIVWEVVDGDTLKSGSMLYLGLGSKVIFNSEGSFSYGTSISMGLLNEYAVSGSNIIGGGSHTPPKFTPSLFVSAFAVYNVSERMYLFAEGTSESLGSFSGGYNGWFELTAGLGLKF